MTIKFFPPDSVKEKWRENWVRMKRGCIFGSIREKEPSGGRSKLVGNLKRGRE
jgi:hypothetical protein